MMSAKIPMPERLRNPRACRFGWIDHRFLSEGFLAQLSGEALRLYVFLVLVANKTGVSWYSYDRICTHLKMDLETYLAARDELLRSALIAYDDHVFQVLPVKTPQPPSVTQPPRPDFCQADDFRALKEVLAQTFSGRARS